MELDWEGHSGKPFRRKRPEPFSDLFLDLNFEFEFGFPSVITNASFILSWGQFSFGWIDMDLICC